MSRRAETNFLDEHRTAFAANLLRRLSDRIVDECGIWLGAQGLRAPARTASTLIALLEHGSLPVTGIAEAVGFSHPFVIRLVDQLERLGLTQSRRDELDGRRRMIVLTEEGLSEARRMAATRTHVGAAIGQLLLEADVDLLADLDSIGRALDRLPLDSRLKGMENSNDPDDPVAVDCPSDRADDI
jgi:DNA-binding MarR family transcriptional regulator